jgi:hypothetical protein
LKNVSRERPVFLADFEGEMPGLGGVLLCGQFLPTHLIDRDSLTPKCSADHFEPVESLGLFIDLTCDCGVNITRLIMESEDILKTIWGADADLTSLRFQSSPQALQIASKSVLDCQLAFSDAECRLGMKRMLQYVPLEITRHLPDKSAIAFDVFHSRNRRAFPIPFPGTETGYSLDDLHRIQAILFSQMPYSGSYQSALDFTQQVQARLELPSYRIDYIKNEMRYFDRKKGTAKESKAVEVTRAITFIRLMNSQLSSADELVLDSAESLIKPILDDAGVVVPLDLSFSGDEPQTHT